MDKGYYRDKRSGKQSLPGVGLVHLCYGRGAGKTSRAVGLAVRAAGAGLKVAFVQFMKSGDSSEVLGFAHIPNISYSCPGDHPFVLAKGPAEVHFNHARQALALAREALENGAEVLICDEILNTLVFGLLEPGDILDLVENCRGRSELLMTGMDAPPEILEAADYATELVQKKHPFYTGQEARKGIEF